MSSTTGEPDCIDRDLACIQCGYNLRTLSCDTICPECGRGVSDTVADYERKERARRFEPWPGCRPWLRRIAASPALMLAAIVCAMCPTHSPAERIATSATAWVLAILAIGWLTLSPGPHRLTGIRSNWRRTLRWLAVALVPPVVLLATWNDTVVAEPLCLLFAALSMLATLLFYAYLGQQLAVVS